MEGSWTFWSQGDTLLSPTCRLLVVTSMMVTLLFFLSDLAARQTQLYRALVVMLSPSSDLHITPQIYISYEICGARRCSIPNTPSGAVILTRPFLSLINGSRNVYNDFGANDVIAWSHNLNLDGHSFTPPWVAILAGLETASLGLYAPFK